MRNLIMTLAVLACLWTSFSDVAHSQIQGADQNAAVVEYKDRLGLIIGYGTGFQTIPIATLTSGSQTSISFGGGTFVQFQYGHQFSRNFDVTIDIGGQFSSLDQKVSNGNMDFNRTILSLTPFYVIPITRDETYRLKIGAGIDFLFNAELNFDLSQISGGIKDDWKYDSAFGEHVSLIVETDIQPRLSISAGARWQNAKYAFSTGGNSFPITGDLRDPNGSGIDILLGVCYHFDWID